MLLHNHLNEGPTKNCNAVRMVWFCSLPMIQRIWMPSKDLPDRKEKDYGREVLALNKLFHEEEVAYDDQNRPVWDTLRNQVKMRKTTRSKEFSKHIVNYNNVLSCTSMGVDAIDHGVGRTTCKIQGMMYHRIGPLMPDEVTAMLSGRSILWMGPRTRYLWPAPRTCPGTYAFYIMRYVDLSTAT